MIPHAAEIKDLAAHLGVDVERGLTSAEAAARLQTYGYNELPPERQRSLWLLFLKQFGGSLDLILLFAAVVSLLLDHAGDAVGILLAVLIRGVVGFVQERKAEGAIARLQDLIKPETVVVRDSQPHRLLARELVPGDILLISEGDRLPADARLIESQALQTDEASLTGESLPVEKKVGVLADVPVSERSNMVWSGTVAAAGQGRALVVATGLGTELGRIAATLADIRRPRTPFENRLDSFARSFGLVTVIIGGAVMALGLWSGRPLLEMFLFSVAMVVSIIPEGLPTVLAIVLAIAVRRMAKRQAIIRHLPSVETLGATEVICTDKTGTLTANQMTVRRLVTAEGEIEVTGEGWRTEGEFRLGNRALLPDERRRFDLLAEACVICNRASLEWRAEGQATVIGEPTEAALLVLAAKAGFDRRRLEQVTTVVSEMPFSNTRRYRATLSERRDDGSLSRTVFVVGAYDAVVPRCEQVLTAEGANVMDDERRNHFRQANAALAGQAMRILAVASKPAMLTQDALGEADINGLILLGLVGMIDPPRAGVAQAIAKCREAGIRVIMVTGDQRRTAAAVAKEIGLLPADTSPDDERLMTETDVVGLDETSFRARLRKAIIFARVTPATKLRIVNALEDQGQTVAMTGDGVNDAPALKRASIGIAMGVVGTDVAKASAGMILADDDFVTIVNAVEEGRSVFRTIKQNIAYLLMTNIGEAVTLLAAIVLGLPLPLLPAQILWMNLVTDTLPDVSLATERSHGTLLGEPPRRRDAPLVSLNTILLTGLAALLMSSGTLFFFLRTYGVHDLDYARTMAFTALSAFQLWNVFNMRSVRSSIFVTGFTSNRYVLGAVGASLLLQLAVIYMPFMQPLFRTVPLAGFDLVMIFGATFAIIPLVEIYKVFLRRGAIPRSWL